MGTPEGDQLGMANSSKTELWQQSPRAELGAHQECHTGEHTQSNSFVQNELLHTGGRMTLWVLPGKSRLTVSLPSLRTCLRCVFGLKPELRGFGLASLLWLLKSKLAEPACLPAQRRHLRAQRQKRETSQPLLSWVCSPAV